MPQALSREVTWLRLRQWHKKIQSSFVAVLQIICCILLLGLHTDCTEVNLSHLACTKVVTQGRGAGGGGGGGRSQCSRANAGIHLLDVPPARARQKKNGSSGSSV